jgi:hypothetical protein
MVKDKTEKELFEEPIIPKVEIPLEAEVKTAKEKDSSKGKVKATVTGIVKGCLMLKDDKENGYKIPITEEYKKYKVGDIITL